MENWQPMTKKLQIRHSSCQKKMSKNVEGEIIYSIAYAPASDEIEVGSRCVFLRSACHRRMLAKSEELEA